MPCLSNCRHFIINSGLFPHSIIAIGGSPTLFHHIHLLHAISSEERREIHQLGTGGIDGERSRVSWQELHAVLVASGWHVADEDTHLLLEIFAVHL